MNKFAWSSPRWLLLVVFCLSGVLPAYAADQDQWYNVELIVFAQLHPNAGNELWPANPGSPDLTGAQEIPTTAVPNAQLQPLPPDQFAMQAEEQKLAKDGNYEILLHTGWRQLGVPREKGIPVHIHTAAPTTPDTAATASAAPTALPPPRLDGVVELTVLRYLHLDVDLLFRGQPVAAADSIGDFFGVAPTKPEIPIYRLQESRRMRSGELHYFDHPMFGVIAMVTPYNPPLVTPPAPAPAASPTVTAPAAPATPGPQTPPADGNGASGVIQRN